MQKLTIGSCFSGIGGLELGLEWTGGFETKWQIENDDYATKVLEKHWPNVKRYSDIRDVVRPKRVDILCGGYPCQPFSTAGQRKGGEDERHLWPEFLRLIRNLRPKYALMENVTGHLSLGFGRVIGDLVECGYDAEWKVLSVGQLGGPHLRKRIFILAYPNDIGFDAPIFQKEFNREGCTQWSSNNDTISFDCFGNKYIPLPKDLFVDDGISYSLGEIKESIKRYGNAVVPQVAQKIGEMILDYEQTNK